MLPKSAESFYNMMDVSGAERSAFETFDRLLRYTQRHTNLISRNSLPDRWARHYVDSTQLFKLVPPSAEALLDIGSGGGFPAVPIAILAQTRRPGLRLSLCESIGKKAQFLENVAVQAGLANIQVLNCRVEALPDHSLFDVITARAVSALPKLIGLAANRLSPGGTLLFPKGQSAEQELDEARKQWSFDWDIEPSMTDPLAKIIRMRSPKRIR